MLYRLSFVLLAVFVAAQHAAAAFDDVPADHPYAAAIEVLASVGVGSETRFYPDRPVALVEFLAMGFVASGRTLEPGTAVHSRFADVPPESWFAPFVSEAERFSLLHDYPERLLPHRTLTRAEASKLGLGLFGFGVPVGIVEEEFGFRDLRPSHRLAPFVFQALKLGAIEPLSDDTFGAGVRMTRGEAADLIVRLATSSGSTGSGIVIIHEQGSSVPEARLLEAVWQQIHDHYLFFSDINEVDLGHAAIRGMVDALGDAYSSFLTPEANDAFNAELSGELEGIGAYLSVDEKTGDIVVVSAIRGTPAARAGLQARDIITHVDAVPTAGMQIHDVTSRIKGAAGTSVTLSISRDGVTRDVSIVREKITINTVDLSFVGTTAVIAVNQFGGTTADEFARAAHDIRARGATRVVLDLRDNPGGLLNVAVDMLGYFLPDNEVAAIAAYRRGSEEIYTTRAHEPSLVDLPLTVVINQGSASASEIVAAALQDHDRAVVIGETSFGKGTMQELIFYRDGTALKLTVAHWLSPLRQPIHEQGVSPDVIARDDPETSADEVIDAAVQAFQKIR